MCEQRTCLKAKDGYCTTSRQDYEAPDPASFRSLSVSFGLKYAHPHAETGYLGTWLASQAFRGLLAHDPVELKAPLWSVKNPVLDSSHNWTAQTRADNLPSPLLFPPVLLRHYTKWQS